MAANRRLDSTLYLCGTVLTDTNSDTKMARKRSSKSNKRLRSPSGRDFVTSIASPRLFQRSVRSQSQLLLDNARLMMQDNRASYPKQLRVKVRPAPKRVSGLTASVGVDKNRSLSRARLQFDLPKQVTVCVRRQIRKEVIHAIGKSGRGAKRRRPRYNSWSQISC